MADTTHAVGRRKEAVCRVYLTPGTGKWEINGRQLGDYFPRPVLVSSIQRPRFSVAWKGSSIQLPFQATENLGRWDVKANIDGGGVAGQAGALRLAIARALVLVDETHRPRMRELGLLTRDARAVERKKPGRAKARKRFQFSKR